jgi:transposase
MGPPFVPNSRKYTPCQAGKRRLADDTVRAATTDEVKQLRREAQDLKEVVAEQALELRLLKKSMIGDGGDQP